MVKRIAVATITGAAVGVIVGTAIFFVTIEIDDGKRWDFAWP